MRKRTNKWSDEAGINTVHAQLANSQPCWEFSPSIATFFPREKTRRPPLPVPCSTTATFLVVVSPSPMSTGVYHHYWCADRHRHHRGPEQSPLRRKLNKTKGKRCRAGLTSMNSAEGRGKRERLSMWKRKIERKGKRKGKNIRREERDRKRWRGKNSTAVGDERSFRWRGPIERRR